MRQVAPQRGDHVVTIAYVNNVGVSLILRMDRQADRLTEVLILLARRLL